MSYSKVDIDSEGNVPKDRACEALRQTADDIEADLDVHTIIMRAEPTEEPDETSVSMFVYGMDARLLRSMVAMLQKWSTQNIPAAGPSN